MKLDRVLVARSRFDQAGEASARQPARGSSHPSAKGIGIAKPLTDDAAESDFAPLDELRLVRLEQRLMSAAALRQGALPACFETAFAEALEELEAEGPGRIVSGAFCRVDSTGTRRSHGERRTVPRRQGRARRSSRTRQRRWDTKRCWRVFVASSASRSHEGHIDNYRSRSARGGVVKLTSGR